MKRRLLKSTAIAVGLCAIIVAVMAATRPENGKITFTKDVAKILHANCATCHHAGEMAPMSLLTYKDVRPWAKSIREAVVSRTMPPWFADPHYGEFANDRRLTQQQIDTVIAWVDGGAKEGEAKDMPRLPEFPNTGWKSGE